MYRVLLVEDEATVREGIVQKIDWRAHGFELAGACENGAQALEILANERLDLIITDINMPMMDGLELSRIVQENWPKTIVVILTGFSDFSYAQSAIHYKVHEYILKPVTSKQLYELLDKLKEELDSRSITANTAAAMRGRFLESLLKGDIYQDLDIESGLRAFDIQFENKPYCVVLIGLAEACGERARADFVESISSFDTGYTAISASEDKTRIIMLYSGEGRINGLEQTLKRVLDGESYPSSAAIGIAVNSIGEIGKSYLSAERACELLYQLQPGAVLRAGALARLKKKDIASAEKRAALLLSAKMMPLDAVLVKLNEYIDEFVESYIPKREIIENLQKLALQISEYAEQEKITAWDQVPALNTLSNSLSLNHVRSMLRDYFTEFVEARDRLGDSARAQATVAVDYIKTHYQDTELSLNKVTRFLSVSTSYFSQLFKNYTGLTFVEYLTQLRIQKAQELLMTTDHRNYEIARLVGYDDPGYFSSTFKKYTGLSPSEFRRKKL